MDTDNIIYFNQKAIILPTTVCICIWHNTILATCQQRFELTKWQPTSRTQSFLELLTKFHVSMGFRSTMFASFHFPQEEDFRRKKSKM